MKKREGYREKREAFFPGFRFLHLFKKTTQFRRSTLIRNNLGFESGAAAANGKIYTARMRELQQDDCDRLTGIVRNYSENATLRLYAAYHEKRERIVQAIRESGLDRILNVFESFNKQYQGDINTLKQYITSLPDEELFSPYGPIQAPFSDGIKNYIDGAIGERIRPDRDTFRMGIEIAGTLIGGFVFDFIKTEVDTYKTIGDIGIYTEHTQTARPGWRYALYPAIYFIDSVVKGYEDKGENLYISATTHPCNIETQRTFSTESGFIELDKNISTAYGPRKMFVCRYSDFLKNFLPRPEKLKIKITNTLVDGEIDWPAWVTL
jgi:hypothetical protein